MRNHLCTTPFCFSDWQYRIFSTKGTFPFPHRKRYFHACKPCVPEAPKTLGSEVKNDNRRIKPSKSTFFSVDTVSVFPKNKASAPVKSVILLSTKVCDNPPPFWAVFSVVTHQQVKCTIFPVVKKKHPPSFLLAIMANRHNNEAKDVPFFNSLL